MPFVHGATFGQRQIFAVIGDRDAEGPRVLERGAHQVTRRHRLAVVAHRDRAGSDQLAELRQLLSSLSQRDGADRIHSRLARHAAPGSR